MSHFSIRDSSSSLDRLHRLQQRWRRGLLVEYALVALFVAFTVIQLLFVLTGGTHPIFNPLDANNPDADLSTPVARWAGYSMMLTRGVFRRGGAPRAEREWDVIAVDDPHGFANLNRLVQWRRAMPTINFHLGSATVDTRNAMGHVVVDNVFAALDGKRPPTLLNPDAVGG